MDNDNREQMNSEMKASTAAKREKKKAGREAKAARKAANRVEEKKSRPNNIILTILIFGVIIGMFAFITGYNYFSKEKSIETYLANNGGEDTYGSMAIDLNTTANITAENNSMTIKLDTTAEDEEDAKDFEEFYMSEDGEKQLKYLGAYFLGGIKPNTRGFSGDATIIANVNDKEVATAEITYKEAKDILENGFGDEDEDADEADADDAAEDDAGEADADSTEE